MKRILVLYMMIGLGFITSCDNDLEVPEEFNTTVLTRQELIALFQNGIMPPRTMVKKLNKTVAGVAFNGIVIDDQFIDTKQLSKWVRRSIKNLDKKNVNSTYIHKVKSSKKNKRVLSVNIITQGSVAISDKEKNAAILALQRYNTLNLQDISFEWVLDFDPANGLEKPNNIGENELQGLSELQIKTLFDTYTRETEAYTSITNENRKDIRIVSDSLHTGMALSRLPDQGNPGNLIILDTDARNLTQKELVILIQHQIGHTLGLVHSDFKTRKSCSFEVFNTQKLKKIYSTIGVDITNSGNNTNALMSTCINDYQNFGPLDIEELKKRYRETNMQTAQ